MTRPVYSIDTHVLYWYEVADPQLSASAEAVFTEAEQGTRGRGPEPDRRG